MGGSNSFLWFLFSSVLKQKHHRTSTEAKVIQLLLVLLLGGVVNLSEEIQTTKEKVDTTGKTIVFHALVILRFWVILLP